MKVYAYEDECPKCGFHLKNLASKVKERLKIPEQWYKWDEQRQEWVAFFKYIHMFKDSVDWGKDREGFSINSLVGVPLYVVLQDLEKAGIIYKLLDHEFYGTYYSKDLLAILSEVLDRVDVYVLYGSSIQELKEKILNVIDEIKNGAEEEYEKGIEISGEFLSKYYGFVPRSKKDFVKDFVQHAMQHFTPPLDKHPVLRATVRDESRMIQWLDETIGKVKRFIQEIERTS